MAHRIRLGDGMIRQPILTGTFAAAFVIFVAISPAFAQADNSKWAGRAFVENKLHEHGMTANYERVTQEINRYVDVVLRGISPEVNAQPILGIARRIFNDPLSQVDETRALTDPLEAAGRAASVENMLAAIAPGIDLENVTAPELPRKPARGAALEAYLDYFARVLAIAKAERDAAFAKLEAAHLEFIELLAPEVMTFVRHSIYLSAMAQLRDIRQVRGVFAIAAQVDRKRLVAAAMAIAALAEPAFLTQLAADLSRSGADPSLVFEGVSGDIVAIHDSAAGKIIVGGTGRNTYNAAGVALILDLGGNDEFGDATASANRAQPISIAIDLAGNDTYKSAKTTPKNRGNELGGTFAQGSAVTGVAMLVDLAGNDTYETAGQVAQGAAIYGVGLLVDWDGNDKYTGHNFAQGVAMYGIGLAFDARGDDVYTAGVYSTGVGFPHGMGVFFDRDGNDTVTTSGEFTGVPSTYGDAGEWHCMGQGAGIGFRGVPGRSENLAGGGVGICCDSAGDDTYSAGQFAMGIGYFLGFGIMKNSRGNDTYNSARYGIATGAHQALSCFIDDEGNDQYFGKSVANQAGNWDTMICTMVDGNGDDTYTCEAGLSHGSATITSFALLYDGGGRDTYTAKGANSIGMGGHDQDKGRNTISMGIFIDRGDQADDYNRRSNADAKPRANGEANVTESKSDDKVIGYGLFIDEG